MPKGWMYKRVLRGKATRKKHQVMAVCVWVFFFFFCGFFFLFVSFSSPASCLSLARLPCCCSFSSFFLNNYCCGDKIWKIGTERRSKRDNERGGGETSQRKSGD